MKVLEVLLLVLLISVLSSCPAKTTCFSCFTEVFQKKTGADFHFTEYYCGDPEEVEASHTYEDEENLVFTSCY